MATLTIQVPEDLASAAASLDGIEVDKFTAGSAIEDIVRDVLYHVARDVLGMAETAGAPEHAEVRSLAARLTVCADALEVVA